MLSIQSDTWNLVGVEDGLHPEGISPNSEKTQLLVARLSKCISATIRVIKGNCIPQRLQK